MSEEVEQCEACHRIVEMDRLLETPLGYFICEDQDECIAEFSGWNSPALPEPTDGKGAKK